MLNTLRIICLNIAVTIVLVVVSDVAAYFLVPKHLVAQFESYRFAPPPGVGGRLTYPKEYFVPHAKRGFDIGPNKIAQHWIDGETYPIWSNALGCFDQEQDGTKPYVYLAGDSFAWGYVPFDKTIGSLIERKTGNTVFKCGVTHTGQRHQYDKMVEVIEKVGRKPRTVLVFYYFNDVANDFVHPHSTVLDGWQIDQVFIDENGALVRLSRAEAAERMAKKLAEIEALEAKRGALARAMETAKRYSLFVSMADHVQDSLLNSASPSHEGESFSDDGGQDLRRFYYLASDANGRLDYADSPRARPNKQAILDFKRLAVEENIDLAMVLVPPVHQAENEAYYEELRAFLGANDIRHLDLSQVFVERHIETSEIYWESDGHLNPLGTDLVTTILIETFPEILGSLE